MATLSEKALAAIDRTDDWTSLYSKLGTSADKSSNVSFLRRARLGRAVLDALYEQNAIVARAVDRLPADALRNGWRIKNLEGYDDLPEIESRLEDLQIDHALKQAGQWSRLYGGAVLTLPAWDGQPGTEPIRLSSIQRMSPPVVVSAYEAMPLETDGNFFSPTYRKTLSYQIQGIAGSGVDVHHSRVIPFEAVQLPPETLAQSPTRWGPSIVERLYDEIARDGSAAKFAVAMMYVSSHFYVKLQGLRGDLLSDGGEERVRSILSNLRQNLDSLGILALDPGNGTGPGDDVGTVSHNLAGVHNILDKTRERLAAAADMPKEILFNESPAGLNAGELSGPQEIWFAHVASYQEDVLTPAINRILEVAFATWGINATSWEIEWNPLWTRSEKSEAEVFKMQAEADAIYVTTIGAASPDEIRTQRFVEGRTGSLEFPEEAGEGEDLDLGSIGDPEIEAYQQANTPLGGQAQDVSSAVEIVKAVAAGEVPRDSGAALLVAAGYSATLLGSAGSEPAVAPEPATAPSTAPEPDDAVSPQDAAARFGVPTRTITLELDRGTLPYWGIGRHRRVSMAAVASLAKSHEVPPDLATNTDPSAGA